MPRRAERQEIYAATERFVEEALERDGSLFTPGANIWTAENIEDLYERFVGHPDVSKDSFEAKFRRQLVDAPPETRQLAAELLFVYLLFPTNMGGDSKRRIVREVLEGTAVEMPEDLNEALDHGMASFGPALMNRPWHLTMLLEFFREWKTMPGREEALHGPWKFKEVVFSVPDEKAGVQREALLHLVYPDTFERIVSQDQKQDIAKHFSYLASEDTEDVDRCMLEIREGLTSQYGDGFNFYDEDVKRLWGPEANKWDAFLRWARKFYEWDAFDENERDYKLEVAARLEQAKDALLGEDDGWVHELMEAFKPPNNLAHWRQSRPFLEWCETNGEESAVALRALWVGSGPIAERIGRFSELLPEEVLRGRGGRLALASVLALADDPWGNPIYRWEPLYKAQKLVDYPAATSDLDEEELYGHTVEFVDRFVEEAGRRGMEMRDRLDAQSLIWCVSRWSAEEKPVSAWEESERRAFLRYRGEEAEEEPWWRPLEKPAGLEAELQRILAAGATDETREILGAVFRRAILLHQQAEADGYLGTHISDPSAFSIMKGNLWTCGVGRDLNFLIQDDPHAREAYRTSTSGRTNGELTWIKVERNPSALEKLLADEKVWDAYERMLGMFDIFPRAHSNHHNVGQMSVLTGERLGKGDELADLVSSFLEERGYPTEIDEKNQAAREEFAEYLSPEAVKNLDWGKLTLIYQTNRYGGTGGMPGLTRYIAEADETGLEKLRRAIEHLLYADLPLERRMDDVLTGEFHVSNLGEAVATKLLSICFPERVLPIFVFDSPKGKSSLMRDPALGLDPPKENSRGVLAIRSNDQLRERLKPYFGHDTNAMKEFLYWLYRREGDGNGSDTLARLAEELLVEKSFLMEVLALLRDKKQIIFYGPPGTGKTYLARKLVEYLSDEPRGHEVVQFHPSYSYEDFVQGYRPVSREDGSLSYELKPGPLMRLARRALDSSEDHVLLIDEINRGNLPKILGELLYLLEYRNDEVSLMYEEEDGRFTMPENLFVIGTMNTADRSIALVDAALRRRFHFVPLFPNEKPIKGLLQRWLNRHKAEMADVADVVDMLNARLRNEFGPHLQIGPSYFMKKDLSEKTLERIWDYDIMPFLEDQLFGHEEELANFTLESLRGEGSADDRVEGVSVDPDTPDE